MKLLLIVAVLVVLTKANPIQPPPTFASIKPKLLKAQLPSNASRIVGGQESLPHARPYQVALYVIFDDVLYFCGGSLISNKFVLTAAHCLEGISGVIALLGAQSIAEKEPTHVYSYTRKFGAHSQYNPETLENDIGYVELNDAVTFNTHIQPIKLPRLSDAQNSYTFKTAIVSGWGVASDYNHYLVPLLREVKVVVIPNADCYYRYNTLLDIPVVHDSNVCTSGVGNVGVCSGDSGGALAVDGVQIGIVSFGLVGYCERTFPTGYTRITSYLRWIQEHTDVEIAQ